MPVIDMETHQNGGSNFSFTGARITQLGSTEYTLASVAVDTTGSTMPFASQLKDMLVAAIEACRKSPRSDNLLVRVVTFDDVRGVRELHGYKPLSEIDAGAYAALQPGGMTPLIDACVDVISATNEYARMLDAQDFAANAITFVITDGMENASTHGIDDVKNALRTGVVGETLESHHTVLIGVGIDASPEGQRTLQVLQRFQRDVGVDQFVDAGEASPQRLAKLGQFVSQSISSTSQALGTGGPSRNISATI